MWGNTSDWDAVVRVYGYPSVENRAGDRASFVKSRALTAVRMSASSRSARWRRIGAIISVHSSRPGSRTRIE